MTTEVEEERAGGGWEKEKKSHLVSLGGEQMFRETALMTEKIKKTTTCS